MAFSYAIAHGLQVVEAYKEIQIWPELVLFFSNHGVLKCYLNNLIEP